MTNDEFTKTIFYTQTYYNLTYTNDQLVIMKNELIKYPLEKVMKAIKKMEGENLYGSLPMPGGILRNGSFPGVRISAGMVFLQTKNQMGDPSASGPYSGITDEVAKCVARSIGEERMLKSDGSGFAMRDFVNLYEELATAVEGDEPLPELFGVERARKQRRLESKNPEMIGKFLPKAIPQKW